VKAIKVENGSATVMPEICVLCGRCVEVCPVGAKRIRDDLSRARQLLRRKSRVYVSLAPSFVTEFPGLEPERLISALKLLGFAGVSETSLGAQEVSAACAALIENGDRDIYISSACPVVVEYIRRHSPSSVGFITPLLSPALAHCRLLKRHFGEEIGIVFINPCVAKKGEADNNSDLLDLSITFEDLRNWFQGEGVDPYSCPISEEHVFLPERAREGALYPMDGGMISGILQGRSLPDVTFMAFSGHQAVLQALEGLDTMPRGRKIFMEILACDGGCVNGPRSARKGATAAKRMAIENYAPQGLDQPATAMVETGASYDAVTVSRQTHTPAQIQQALILVGKSDSEDELNCGGCGYYSCRDFAMALLEGRAEPSMCVSYMRKLAMKKANALIKAIPSGVVIVDRNLKVIECNERFARLLGDDAQLVFDARRGLEGASMEKLVPFHNLFTLVMEGSEEVLIKDLRLQERIVRLSVFPIEKGRIVGAILQDITQPAVRREHIVDKAREVIKKNLTTVQKIACLLGENAAESEIILNSIIESFSISDAGDEKKN
jgi:iron only hydrogenase large subunit-like protein